MAHYIESGVTFVKRELRAALEQYQVITDAMAGEAILKSQKKTEIYLPNPSPANCDPIERELRYDSYVTRAVYYNAIRRTLQGLVGEVFSKPPVLNVEGLDALLESASGDGVSLLQQSKLALGYVIAYSRAGLLVDYPKTDSPTTKAQLDSGEVRPTVTLYHPGDIRNWKTAEFGAEERLTMVVLREKIDEPVDNDEFATQEVYVYRVLKLVDDAVVVDLWRPKLRKNTSNLQGGYNADGMAPNYEIVSSATMLNNNGEPMDRIPFRFIGLLSNGASVEQPAFYDLAAINLGHYRNSADYEEACFICGQPTVAVSGLDENWLGKVLGGQIRVGSRGGVPLPVGGTLTMVQAQPNMMLKEAMDAKERQMVALGARLVESSGVQRTATEARMEDSSDASILQSAARNVSEAYLWALEQAGELVGIATDEFEFKLNDDFDISRMGAADRQDIVKSWQAGLLTWSEARAVMRSTGLATLDDETAKAETDKEKEDNMSFELEKESAVTEMATDSAIRTQQANAKSESAPV